MSTNHQHLYLSVSGSREITEAEIVPEVPLLLSEGHVKQE